MLNGDSATRSITKLIGDFIALRSQTP